MVILRLDVYGVGVGDFRWFRFALAVGLDQAFYFDMLAWPEVIIRYIADSGVLVLMVLHSGVVCGLHSLIMVGEGGYWLGCVFPVWEAVLSVK